MRQFLLFLVFIISVMVFGLNSQAQSIEVGEFSKKHVDVVLTEDRVCKKCIWRFVDVKTVELKNKKGISGFYPLREILGVDSHPFWRKALIDSASSNWAAGETILPNAVKDKFHFY